MTLKTEAQEKALWHGREEVWSEGHEDPRGRGNLGGISCEDWMPLQEPPARQF